MDTEDEDEEAPTLVSNDAEEDEDEEVTFFPVDKMLHEQVHSFLEVGVKKTFEQLAPNWSFSGAFLPLRTTLSLPGDESSQVTTSQILHLSWKCGLANLTCQSPHLTEHVLGNLSI